MPIVCEVKLTSRREDRLTAGQDPFYALIQALASAVSLPDGLQRKRLSKAYPSRLRAGFEQLDAYIMLADEPTRATYCFDLRTAAQAVASSVIAANTIGWLRKIRFVTAKLDGDDLRFELLLA